MEKFVEHLEEARKITKTIDHLIYVTFPVVKDKRLLLKTIIESKNSIAHCINAVLQYEYSKKRIKLYKDSKINFRTFVEKCSFAYGITDNEMKLITELFIVAKNHEKSPLEFLKEDKVVVLSEDMSPKILTIEKIKEFVILTKNILGKVSRKIFG